MGEPTHVLEVEAGQGDPPMMPFEEGVELAPFTIGRKGSWRLGAGGVREVHAFFYFDGSALFVQSADDREPVFVDGTPVGKAWTELAPPCHIQLGQALLRFRALYTEAQPEGQQAMRGEPFAEERTPATLPLPRQRASEPMASQSRRERPFAPGALASSDDEATRVGHPVAASVRLLRPAAGVPAPARGYAPVVSGGYPVQLSGAHPMGPMAPMEPHAHAPHAYAPHAGDPSNAPAPPAPPAAGLESLNARWQALSPPRRWLVVLAPFCLVATYFLLFTKDEPVGVPGTVAAGVASVASGPPAVGTAPSPAAAPAPLPPVVVAPAVMPTVAPPASAAVAPAPELRRTPGQKTLERMALDHVATGDFLRATHAYEQLAASNPDNRVWTEALRILRARVDAGAP